MFINSWTGRALHRGTYGPYLGGSLVCIVCASVCGCVCVFLEVRWCLCLCVVCSKLEVVSWAGFSFFGCWGRGRKGRRMCDCLCWRLSSWKGRLCPEQGPSLFGLVWAVSFSVFTLLNREAVSWTGTFFVDLGWCGLCPFRCLSSWTGLCPEQELSFLLCRWDTVCYLFSWPGFLEGRFGREQGSAKE
jgi:hypothetical protein